MNKARKEAFRNHIELIWRSIKASVRPEYHERLRRTFRQVIKEDEKEYREFVELMETEKPKPEEEANKQLQEAAHDRADELQDIETGAVTHQCHYCGEMYHISDLTGAREGLICYKCRIELENRE